MSKFVKRGLATGVLVIAGYFGWDSGKALALYLGPSERLLSQTGFDLDLAKEGTLEGAYFYEPSYPFWSDGALKQRYVYIPDGMRVDNSNADRWNFPEGTRIWKTFERDGVLVETRMLYKIGLQPWQWDMAAYAPIDDGSDSRKLVYARSNTEGTMHDIPSAGDCRTCHSSDERRRALGISSLQLPWSDDNGLSLTKMIQFELLSDPPKTPYVIPGDTTVQAALGYFDSNCGSCHYEGSTYVTDKIHLRLNLIVDSLGAVEDTNVYRTAVNQAPYIDGLDTSVYVHPGNPSKSFVYKRMSVRDRGIWQMPPLATELTDQDGLALIRRWILTLDH